MKKIDFRKLTLSSLKNKDDLARAKKNEAYYRKKMEYFQEEIKIIQESMEE